MRGLLLALLLAAFALGLRAQAAASTERPPTVKMAVVLEHLATTAPIHFPPMAQAAHVSGLVTVGVEIDEEGKVTQQVILSGPEMLRAAAIESVQKWTFHPILVDGKPARVRSAIQIMFNDVNSSARIEKPKAK